MVQRNSSGRGGTATATKRRPSGTAEISESRIGQMTADAIRGQLRRRGVSGISGLRKPELVKSLVRTLRAEGRGGSTATKAAARKTTAKKAPARKAGQSSTRTAATKAPAKKAPARKTVAAKAPAKRATARKTVAAKRAPAKKTAAKAPAKRAAAKQAPARKAPAKKAPARKTVAAARKAGGTRATVTARPTTGARKAPAKQAPPTRKATAKQAPAKKAPAKKATAKTTTARKAPARKATAAKAPVKRAPAKQATARKAAAPIGGQTAPSRSLKYAQQITSTQDQPERPGRSLVTREHDVIRRWAEARDAQPATIEGTERDGRLGVLTFDFPGWRGGGRLRPVSWDEWFHTFDVRRLNFIYQEQLSDGRQSNFFRTESPEREDG